MIWQVARVIDTGADRLTLGFSTPSTCSRCARGQGCGAGLFSALVMRSFTRVDLASNADARVGERVRVGVMASRLAVAAAVHYGIPLLAFLSGASLAHGLSAGFAGQDLAALAGGLAAFVLSAPLIHRFVPISVNPRIERLSCTTDDTTSSNS